MRLQIEKHAEVGVIEDPVVDADAISQFMTKMAHVVSTDLSYRFDRAERDDRNHWHPLSDGGCSQGEQTASTKKLSIVKISMYKDTKFVCARNLLPIELSRSSAL